MAKGDLDIARGMLTEAQACSYDFEADDEFALAAGLDPLEDWDRAHRRRLAALRELVRLGEAESWWTGITEPPAGAPRRARMYAKK